MDVMHLLYSISKLISTIIPKKSITDNVSVDFGQSGVKEFVRCIIIKKEMIKR